MFGHVTMLRLALPAGYSSARAMPLAGEDLGGEAAHRIGFVQRLAAPPASAQESAESWATRIATLGPLTIDGHKLGLNALEQPLRVDTDEQVQAAFDRAWSSADPVEGMAAGNDGRPRRSRGACSPTATCA